MDGGKGIALTDVSRWIQSVNLEVRARKKFRTHKNRKPIVQATVNLQPGKAGTRLAGRFALSLLHPGQHGFRFAGLGLPERLNLVD